MKTAFCKKCGHKREINQMFCSKCGTKYEVGLMLCVTCGTEYTANQIFCAKCGDRIIEGLEPETIINNEELPLGYIVDNGTEEKATVESIIRYKKSLGYSDNPQNFVMAMTNEYTGWGFGAAISAFINKIVVISFEPSGLLIFELSLTYKIAGNSVFIDNDEINNIIFDKEKPISIWNSNGNSRLAQKALFIDGKNGSQQHFSVQKFILGSRFKWVKENLRYVMNNYVQLLGRN